MENVSGIIFVRFFVSKRINVEILKITEKPASESSKLCDIDKNCYKKRIRRKNVEK